MSKSSKRPNVHVNVADLDRHRERVVFLYGAAAKAAYPPLPA